MAKREFEITSIFDKWLARRARDLADKVPGAKIIQAKDFPAGAPIHEDGSSEYDPRKPLVLFALSLSGKRANDLWRGVLREYDQLVNGL